MTTKYKGIFDIDNTEMIIVEFLGNITRTLLFCDKIAVGEIFLVVCQIFPGTMIINTLA